MPSHPIEKKTVGALGEFGLIARIAGGNPKAAGRLVLGIGDDCAAFRQDSGKLLLATCDIQVEGRHFVKERSSARDLGLRCAAVNLSDIAAMGGTALYALISLGLPPQTPTAWVDGLYKGLREGLGRFGAAIIGGNITSSAMLIIDITLLGEMAEVELLRRGTAKPGEAILVTGTVGASAMGRIALERRLRPSKAIAPLAKAHRTPTPRIREGRVIASSGLATAMIDVSDGLAGDLGHICETSGIGASLDASALPIAPATRSIARSLRLDPLAIALHGGEDYELLFTCPKEQARNLTERVRRETGTPVALIGETTSAQGILLRHADGRREHVEPTGWDHFAKQRAKRKAS